MDESTMKHLLASAQDKLRQQGELLQRLTETPLVYATVIATGTETKETEGFAVGTKVMVKNGFSRDRQAMIQQVDAVGEELLVKFDDGDRNWVYRGDASPIQETIHRNFVVIGFEGKQTEVEAHATIKVKAGDVVKLSSESMQIVGLANIDPTGETVVVRRVLDGNQLEVDSDGSTKIINTGVLDGVEKGDKLIIDSTCSVALRNLGKADERYTVTHDTNVSWDDIGGLEEAKKTMIEAVELPLIHSDLYSFYGKKPVKGVLLYGPPGCGKTMLGKATATALAKLHGVDGSEGYFYVKGPEILDKYVGVAESNIRQIFERARKFRDAHGYPAVVFIDEADAIMGKRGTGISSDIERTIVPMFLTEMDGLDESGAIIILATNRPDVLDPAIVRDGRIDRKVKVTRPTQASATEIFKLNLRNVPLNNGYTRAQLAEDAASALFDPKKSLYTISLKNGTSMDFPLSAVVNGGMVASIVDQATSAAMLRDIENGTKGGMRWDDLLIAVQAVYEQNRDLDHKDEVTDFVAEFRSDITDIRRVSVPATN